MIDVFGDEHLRHSGIGREPTLDQPCRRLCPTMVS